MNVILAVARRTRQESHVAADAVDAHPLGHDVLAEHSAADRLGVTNLPGGRSRAGSTAASSDLKSQGPACHRPHPAGALAAQHQPAAHDWTDRGKAPAELQARNR